MHYASQLSDATYLDILLRNGANKAIKNNEKQSPLHFGWFKKKEAKQFKPWKFDQYFFINFIASSSGRYSNCFQLLNANNYKNYINEKDSNGKLILGY